jgi:hypothetical protein
MEPERPIEKVLRAAAAKRRAEAGDQMPLHPANRRILQAEIAKTYGPKRERKSSALNFWPQLGWSFAVIIGVAIAASMMMPRDTRKSMDLAENNRSATMSRAAAPSGGAGLTRGTTRGLTDISDEDRVTMALAPVKQNEAISGGFRDDLAKSPGAKAEAPAQPALAENAPEGAFRRRYGLDASASRGAPAAPPVANSAPSGAGLQENEVTKKAEASSRRALTSQTPAQEQARAAFSSNSRKQTTLAGVGNQLNDKAALATSTNALVPAAASTVAVNADGLGAAFQTVRFARIKSPEAATPPADYKTSKAIVTDHAPAALPLVLMDFEWQQDADKVRIVDHDGSVYQGTFGAVPEAAVGAIGQVETAAGKDERKLSPSSPASLASYSFTVAGTNIALGQKIVFNGNITAPAVLRQMVVPALRSRSNSEARLESPAAQTHAVTNAQITGYLRIGDESPVRVQAQGETILKKP